MKSAFQVLVEQLVDFVAKPDPENTRPLEQRAAIVVVSAKVQELRTAAMEIEQRYPAFLNPAGMAVAVGIVTSLKQRADMLDRLIVQYSEAWPPPDAVNACPQCGSSMVERFSALREPQKWMACVRTDCGHWQEIERTITQ